MPSKRRLTDEERKESQAASRRKYYLKNRERELARNSAYTRQHLDIYREQNKRYYAKNKERVKQKNLARYHRKKLENNASTLPQITTTETPARLTA
jgi:hypothetical protein